MVNQCDMTIDGMLKALPTRKAAEVNGKRKVDNDNAHQFSVDILVRDFLRFPASPLHWNLMNEFSFLTEDGANTTQFLLGKVISWGEHGGVYIWTIKFSNMRQVTIRCQDLAECVHEAHSHGVDITGYTPFDASI